MSDLVGNPEDRFSQDMAHFCHFLIPTIDSKPNTLTESPCHNILGTTSIVAGVTKPGNVDNEAALTRDDEVIVPFVIYLLTILQPEHLKKNCIFDDNKVKLGMLQSSKLMQSMKANQKPLETEVLIANEPRHEKTNIIHM